MPSVPEELQAAIDIFESRNKEYGHCYARHGDAMQALLPHGVTLETELDFFLWNKFENIIGKCARIAANIENGKIWHADSSKDIIVYSAMALEKLSQIKEMTNEKKNIGS